MHHPSLIFFSVFAIILLLGRVLGSFLKETVIDKTFKILNLKTGSPNQISKILQTMRSVVLIVCFFTGVTFMKPIIGVTPLWDDEKTSLWMLPGYMDGVRNAGGLPIMLPLTSDPEELDQLSQLCAGVLLTGGHDVCPERYHEQPLSNLVSVCADRDAMELQLLHLALQQDKPILGICRGIQFINAALGGTLYQDLPTQHPSSTEHHMVPPYDRRAHTVTILKQTPLYDLLRVDTLGVNSYHHQAIKELSPQLAPMAISEDGLIESVYMPGEKFLWATQWHPEFSWKSDEASRKIFRAFVQTCE